MHSRPQSPDAAATPLSSLRRGVSRMSKLVRSASPTRPMSQTFAAPFARAGKTTSSASHASSADSTITEKQAPLHRSSSAGNMLQQAMLVPVPKKSAAAVHMPRPASVNGLEALLQQQSPSECFYALRKERIRFRADTILAMPTATLQLNALGLLSSSPRFEKVRDLFVTCPAEFAHLVPWQDLLKSCWQELDASFDHLYAFRDCVDPRDVTKTFVLVPNLIEKEPLQGNALKEAIEAGVLPIAQRLQKEDNGAFEFLVQHALFAADDRPLRPRKSSSRRGDAPPKKAREVWEINTSDNTPLASTLFLAPTGGIRPINRADWPAGSSSEDESSLA